MALDSQGNLIVGGFFGGTIDFGTGALIGPMGAVDAFVAKFDVNGKGLWAKKYGSGGPLGTRVNGLAIDAMDNVVVTGSFDGTVDFGGGPLVSQGMDMFVAKLDPGGGNLWSKRFGDGGNNDSGTAIAVDLQGDLVVTGGFGGNVDFGGGALIGGNYSGFLLKLDSSGTHVWSKACGGAVPAALATNALKEVIVTGFAQNGFDFGGNPHMGTPTPEVILAKLNAAGLRLWDQSFDAYPASSQGRAVAFDASGEILLFGDGGFALDFGGGPIGGTGDPNGFVVVFDGTGKHVWSKGFGTKQTNTYGGAVSAKGDIAMVGSFTGAFDLGGGALMTPPGELDIFDAKLDSSGKEIWAQNPGLNFGAAVAFGSGGAVFLTGGYAAGATNFGDGVLPTATFGGIFIAKRPP